MPRPLLFAPLLLALAACSPHGDTDLTYYTDIQPLLQTHCTRCHFDGGPGPIDLSDPAEVVASAELIASAVDAGRMPPPAADPDCRDYEGSERMHLPDDKKALLREWVDGAAPLGNEDEAVTAPEVVLDLPDANLELRMEHAYQPRFDDPDNPGNEYRCFIIDPGHTETFFIEAMAPIIDAQSLVHHIVLFTMPRDERPANYDPEVGYGCINDSGPVDGMVAGWAPGAVPLEFEAGKGLRIADDEVLVMQMHYFQSGPDVPFDQSGYQFRTVDSAQRVYMLPLGSYDFFIPAGEEAHTHQDSFRWDQGFDIEVLATFPHMHVLGSGYRAWIEDEAGEKCLVESDRYDFDNQMTYEFKESFFLRDGDTVHWECTWNNSTSNPDRVFDDPVDTRYGERTDEEMCFFFTMGALAL